jgi:hypothetical protein
MIIIIIIYEISIGHCTVFIVTCNELSPHDDVDDDDEDDDDDITPDATCKAGQPRHQPHQVCKKEQGKAKRKGNVKPDIEYHTALERVSQPCCHILAWLVA